MGKVEKKEKQLIRYTQRRVGRVQEGQLHQRPLVASVIEGKKQNKTLIMAPMELWSWALLIDWG